MTSKAELDFLLARSSVPPRLMGDPAPSAEELDQVIAAGLRAPDHAGLKPWRFIVIEGEGRNRLGDLFVEATVAREPGTEAAKLEDIRAKPLRSPMIIAVCAIYSEHPKVPKIEQIASAAAAGQSMLLALQALGYGGIMLTGPNAHDAHVKQGLGLKPEDEIVAFLYTGTPSGRTPDKPRPETKDFVTRWPA